MYVCMYVYIYIYMYVCVCIYIYIYIECCSVNPPDPGSAISES